MRKACIAATASIWLVAYLGIGCGKSNDTQKLSALNDALKSGVITREEYDAKVAQLKKGDVDKAKKAALDDAFKNGLLTMQEYDAKLQALMANSPGTPAAPATAVTADSAAAPTEASPIAAARPIGESSSQSAPAQGAGAANGRSKTIEVVDTVLSNMPAYKIAIPADWTMDGAILRSSCGEGLPFLVFRAYSPDKLTGSQIIPQADWYSAADPRAYQMSGVGACNLHAPAHASDVAAKIAADLRPGAQIMGLRPLTPVQEENVRKQNEQGKARMAQMNQQVPANFAGTYDIDMQRVQIRYDFEGRPVEEMLTVALIAWGGAVSISNTGPGGIIQPATAHMIHTTVRVSAIRAPAGQLDATVARLERDLKIDMVKEWDDAEIAVINRRGEAVRQAIEKSGIALRQSADQFAAQMQRSNDQYHAWQNERRVAGAQKFAEDMRRKDSQSQNFLDYVKDQSYYLNPSTGQTMTIQNQVGVSGYVGQTQSGGWTQLVPISH